LNFFFSPAVSWDRLTAIWPVRWLWAYLPVKALLGPLAAFALCTSFKIGNARWKTSWA